MDELFTFIGSKTNYAKRTVDELFEFEFDLPKVKRVYSDEAFA